MLRALVGEQEYGEFRSSKPFRRYEDEATGSLKDCDIRRTDVSKRLAFFFFFVFSMVQRTSNARDCIVACREQGHWRKTSEPLVMFAAQRTDCPI